MHPASPPPEQPAASEYVTESGDVFCTKNVSDACTPSRSRRLAVWYVTVGLTCASSLYVNCRENGVVWGPSLAEMANVFAPGCATKFTVAVFIVLQVGELPDVNDAVTAAPLRLTVGVASVPSASHTVMDVVHSPAPTVALWVGRPSATTVGAIAFSPLIRRVVTAMRPAGANHVRIDPTSCTVPA